MGVLDKKFLLSELQERLGDVIPANMVNAVLTATEETLAGYEINVSEEHANQNKEESQQIIRMFLDAKEVEGKAESTIERYRYILTNLVEATQVPVLKMNVYHLRQYMMQEKARGISMNTIKASCHVFSVFFSWLHSEGIINKNPTANIGSIKATRVEEPPFTSEEIQLIKEAASNDVERAVVHFLLSTGCRVSELCSVNRSDIDFRTLKFEVIGKGNKKRTVYIDDVTCLMLKRYLATRTDIDPALFYSKRSGQRYTDDGIRVMLKRLEERSHVPGVHPHRFRHTLATNLVDRGMNLQEVSAILGHSKLDTTMMYVHMNQRNTENSYRKFACN